MLRQKPTGGNKNSARTRYVVIVTLPGGEREVADCDSMIEALLFRFECEAICFRGGFDCPPLRVELRAA
jgi:hypothetical protein